MFFAFSTFSGLGKFRFLFVGLVAVFLPKFNVLAQTPILRFLSDSVQVGEHTQAVFYYKHSPDQEIVFPDSNFNFKPFEFVSKTYFPTVTTNGESLDSVVYTLSIFEIEGTHSLQLPIILFRGKDTLRLYAQSDSITIKPLITAATDSLKLKSNTQLLELEQHFNYSILIIVVVALLLLIGLGYLIFGKNIFAEIAKYRRKVAHERFLKLYDSMVADATSLSPPKMEEAVSLWKKYIEKLEDKPYTTFTSSEIGLNLKNESIKKNLQNIDVAIYSGRAAEVASQDFAALREVAVSLYTQRQSDKKK